MVPYYVTLATRSFRRNKVLTALMICAIALGIGASMTTMTVLYVLSGDPIPEKSDKLYRVQLDPYRAEGFQPGNEPDSQLTRFDAETLLREKRADRQAVMTGGDVAIEPNRAGLSPFYASARYASADFFTMFSVPFASGSPWSATEDETRARVVVLSKKMAEKLFSNDQAVGKSFRINGEDFRVIGVLDSWEPTPHFYDLHTGAYGNNEQVFLPFSTSRDLDFSHSGSMSCWDANSSDTHSLNASCVWLQFWVELRDKKAAAEYRDYLINYSEEQLSVGRYERPPNVRLRNVMEWLEHKKVVPGDVRLQAWLAFGFLLVCLLNTVGLLLAKFMRRSQEIGVRRALGASRGSIFSQLLVEAGAIGLIGAAFGLLLVWAGLWAVRAQPTSYADLIHLDSKMLVATVGLAVFSSILAALVPAWRACFVSPALQVKTQ